MIIGGRVFNPGDLRTPVSLEQRSVPAEPGGFNVPVWESVYALKAKWTNAHGSDLVVALAGGGVALETCLVRYQPGIDRTWSIVKGGVRFEIVSIDDIGERHQLLEFKVKLFEAD